MLALEQVERYARLNEGGRSPWKKRALDLVAEHWETIQVFRALGLGAVMDPDTKILIGNHMGPCPEGQEDEYGFNVWIFNELACNRVLDDNCIFFTCNGCKNLRTQRGIHFGGQTCRYCGTTVVLPYIGPTETRDNLYRLVRGD